MDRVELAREFGKRPARTWRCAALPVLRCRFISVGQLADGRWYAHRTGLADAFVFHDEASAQRMTDLGEPTVKTRMPMQAVFDGDGNPVDGG